MPAIAVDLGALAAFLFLLLIAAALWVLIELLRNTLGRLPVVGNWITTNIGGALNDARNAIISAQNATWTAGADLFRWAQAILRNIPGAILTAVAEVYQFTTKVRDVWLPGLESRVLVTASGWVSNAESYALQLETQAIVYVDSRVSAAVTYAGGLFRVAESDAAAAYQSAVSYAGAAFRTAETDAARLVSSAGTALAADIRAVESFAASGIAAVETIVRADVAVIERDLTAGLAAAETFASATAHALTGGVYTDLDTWGRQAVADAWPDAQKDIGALRQTLGQDFPWLNDLLGALGGLGAAGLAGTLIQSIAGAHAITRLADECIVPNCRNLSGLGNDLSNLLGTASTAAMLAWLIFGVTDPAGWAGETARAAAPVASGLANDAARLFG